MKAKAALLYEPKTAQRVEEIDVESPHEGEVLVKLAASGVCYSNYHTIHGYRPNQTYPVILGDEGAGTVVEVGQGVTKVKPDDPVVLSWAPYCSNCFYCHRGDFHLCESAGIPSRFSRGGQTVYQFGNVSSFSQYTVVPESGAIPIRADVPLDKAALVGCAVPTGWGAVVNTAGVGPGDSVAIIGLGGIGLSAVMGAVTVNADKIIGVDINGAKLELSKDFGVTHTIDSSVEDMVENLKELTGGLGPDYCFDTIGLPEVTSKAYEAVRRGGTVVTVGVNADWAEVTLKFPLIYGERKLLGCTYGSISPPVDIPRILDLYMSGKLDLDKLITKKYPLEGINDAFDAMLSGETARNLIEF